MMSWLLGMFPYTSLVSKQHGFQMRCMFWGLAWETQGLIWPKDVDWLKAYTLTLMTSSTMLSNGQSFGYLLALPPLSVGLLSILTWRTKFCKVVLLKGVYITQPINFWFILPITLGMPPQTSHLRTLPNSSSLVWHSSRLFFQGLIQSSYEHNLYFHRTNNGLFLLLLLYVDNILLTWNNHTFRHSLQVALYHHLCMSFMDNLSYYLNVEYVFCKIGALLTQHHYITKMSPRPLS